MTRYQKIFSFVFVGLFILILGLLIFASRTTNNPNIVLRRLHRVVPDSLVQITISQKNSSRISILTSDTIKIQNKETITNIINNLNIIHENFSGRGIPKTWEVEMTLEYKNHKNIKLIVCESDKGICVSLTNTMGTPKYKCDELKAIIEEILNDNKDSDIQRILTDSTKQRISNKQINPNVNSDNSIEDSVDVLPEFHYKNCSNTNECVNSFIREIMIWPDTDSDFYAKITINCIVEKNGMLSNFKVDHPIHPLLDKESLNMIKQMPKWKPAIKNGKVVRSRIKIPVTWERMS